MKCSHTLECHTVEGSPLCYNFKSKVNPVPTYISIHKIFKKIEIESSDNIDPQNSPELNYLFPTGFSSFPWLCWWAFRLLSLPKLFPHVGQVYRPALCALAMWASSCAGRLKLSSHSSQGWGFRCVCFSSYVLEVAPGRQKWDHIQCKGSAGPAEEQLSCHHFLLHHLLPWAPG